MEFYEPFLKNLEGIFRLGYVPHRGYQPYVVYDCIYDEDCPTEHYADVVRCYVHACFNLKNEDYRKMDYNDLENATFPLADKKDFSKTVESLMGFVKKVGLKVTRVSVFDKVNPSKEWKVAIYQSRKDDEIHDYHFFRQEPDGNWSCKQGQYVDILEFQQLPNPYFSEIGTRYDLYDVYKIENPFAKDLNEKVK